MQAYENLHSKFELVWNERDQLAKLLLEKDIELRKLKNLVLTEGLQLSIDTIDCEDQEQK